MALQLTYDTTDSTKQGLQTSVRSYYQSFIPAATFVLDGLQINIDNIVAGLAKASIYFYNADVDGKPTGQPLGGGSIGFLNTGDSGWQGDLGLSGSVTLTGGNRYCFRLQGFGTSGEYYFDFDSTDSYANGTCWYWSGSEYVAQNGDINFKIYGVATSPSKAINPTPGDKAVDILRNQATIAWEDGGGADTYDVWWGDSPETLVKVSSLQAGLTFNLAAYHPLDCGKIHYWRIDSVNDGGTTEGDLWSFATIPGVGWIAEDDEEEMLLNYLGEVYIIEPGNTELRYIYWDPDISETILQSTDDQSVIKDGDFSVLCFNDEGIPHVY